MEETNDRISAGVYRWGCCSVSVRDLLYKPRAPRRRKRWRWVERFSPNRLDGEERSRWSRSALTDRKGIFAHVHHAVPSGGGGDGGKSYLDIEKKKKKKIPRADSDVLAPRTHVLALRLFGVFLVPFRLPFLAPTRHIGSLHLRPLGYHASTAPLCRGSCRGGVKRVPPTMWCRMERDQTKTKKKSALHTCGEKCF
jgi:hypothetical protein